MRHAGSGCPRSGCPWSGSHCLTDARFTARERMRARSAIKCCFRGAGLRGSPALRARGCSPKRRPPAWRWQISRALSMPFIPPSDDAGDGPALERPRAGVVPLVEDPPAGRTLRLTNPRTSHDRRTGIARPGRPARGHRPPVGRARLGSANAIDRAPSAARGRRVILRRAGEGPSAFGSSCRRPWPARNAAAG
jgi:hypothetical protein